MRNVAQSLISGLDAIERAIGDCHSPAEACELAKLARDAARKYARLEDAAWDRADRIGDALQLARQTTANRLPC